MEQRGRVVIFALMAGALAPLACGSRTGLGPLAGVGSDAGAGEGSLQGSSAAPSCASSGEGTQNCGPSGENCCATFLVEAGTFFRTYHSEADGAPTGQADPATVSDFHLDKYLVTVGRFRQFVSAWNDG